MKVEIGCKKNSAVKEFDEGVECKEIETPVEEESVEVKKEWCKEEHLRKYCRRKLDEVHMPHTLARDFLNRGKWQAAYDALEDDKERLRKQLKMMETCRIAIRQSVELGRL